MDGGFRKTISIASTPVFSTPGLRHLAPSLDRLLRLHKLDRMYHALPRNSGIDEFLEGAIEALGVKYRFSGSSLDQLPASGPLVIVANHPFGGIEGILLTRELRRYRPDVKVMANHLLGRIPELQELMLLVDAFGGTGSKVRNHRPMRQVLEYIMGGGALLVFPAGAVSHLDLARGQVSDPPWRASIASLVRRSGAAVLPVHVVGSNSPLFQMVGVVHPVLRTLLLPRELQNKQRRPIELIVGSVIPPEALEARGDDTRVIRYLRLRTYALGGSQSPSVRPLDTRRKPVATAGSQRDLVSEIEALPPQQKLGGKSGISVWYADPPQIPNLLREIGRLREISFRAVGEGSGKALDLDRFDLHYGQLFLWDHNNQRLVGGYRLGQTDRILQQRGLRGLYTRTLFRYNRAFLAQTGPALELGRSFVVPEYQKTYLPLLLLWQGISAYVAANPRYATLFGPVSISRDYGVLARSLIAGYLVESVVRGRPRVRPRHPMRHRALPGLEGVNPTDLLRDMDDLQAVVEDLNSRGEGVPVLIRQYLKLGGEVLASNLDPDFADALDLLLLVDLRKSDRRQLSRYMGAEAAQNFLAWHEQEISRCA